METVILRGVDIARFFHAMDMEPPDDMHTLRINVARGSVKVKRNEWVWSPPLGETDPGR